MEAVGATRQGRKNQLADNPNEDHFTIVYHGDYVISVISDGCGTATSAAEGAQATSTLIVKGLQVVADQLRENGPGQWMVDAVFEQFLNVRKELISRYGPNLGHYAATVVASIADQTGGVLVHLGDGIAAAYAIERSNLSAIAISEPENGEYANETYYLTDQRWAHHLRLTPHGPADLIVLASDGAQDIFYLGNQIREDTINIFKDTALGSQPIIDDLFDLPEVRERTNDDHTLVFIRNFRDSTNEQNKTLLEKQSLPLPKHRPKDQSIDAPAARTYSQKQQLPNQFSRNGILSIGKNQQTFFIGFLLGAALASLFILIVLNLSDAIPNQASQPKTKVTREPTSQPPATIVPRPNRWLRLETVP